MGADYDLRISGNVYDEPTGLHDWAPALMGHLAFQSPICGWE
jgi:hypothetical protein